MAKVLEYFKQVDQCFKDTFPKLQRAILSAPDRENRRLSLDGERENGEICTWEDICGLLEQICWVIVAED